MMTYSLPFKGSRGISWSLQALGSLAEDGRPGPGAHDGHHHGPADIGHQVGDVTSCIPRSLPPATFRGSGEIIRDHSCFH